MVVARLFFCLPLYLSRPLTFVLYFPWGAIHLLGPGLGGGQRGACNDARTTARKQTVYYLAMNR